MSYFSSFNILEKLQRSSDGISLASLQGEAQVPGFILSLIDQRVLEGQPVWFVCVTNGHPRPQVKWLWNGKPIPQHEDFVATTEDNVHKLLIGHAYPEDEGVFTAQAFTDSWVQLSQAKLTVDEIFPNATNEQCSLSELNCISSDLEGRRETNHKGENPLEMAKMLKKKIKVKPGDTALLECTLDPSDSSVQVKWLKEDEEIFPQSSQRYKVRHDESGVHSLEIADIISDDEGEYSCVATTKGSTTSSSTELIMKERKPKPWDPVPARFLNRIEDLTVTEGEEAMFRCQIVGHPIPEVTWYQDDEVLCSCQDVKMTFDGRTTFMIIAAAYPEDSGQYTCQIYNGLGGRLTCSAYLKVKKIKSRKLVPKTPEFTEVFHDRTVLEGTEVKFVCRIRGNPKPKVSWLFNNKELKQSPDFLFFRKHNLYVLHIVEAFPEDEGEYTCKAVNSVGETQWSAGLFVEEQQSSVTSPAVATNTANFFRPSFLSHTKDCKAIEGGPATFNCKVTGSPKPEVVWLYNQSEINEDDHYILEHGEDGSCMIIIPHATPKDVGEYMCVARSTLGVAHSVANLEVMERVSDDDQEQDSGYRGQETQLTDGLPRNGSGNIPCRPVGKPNVAKIAGESILLTWETIPTETDGPDSSIMYIIEGKDASEVDWILIATDVNETSYWVSSINPEGGYVFRVRAEGVNGISEPSEESDVVCLMDLLSRNKQTCESSSKSSLKKYNALAVAKDIKPFFMDSLEDVYVLQHGTAVLSCKVLCEPPPIVKWYREEDIIANDDRIQATYEEDGTCQLEIKDVTYNDIGEYECVAENKIGKASCRLYLDVAEPPGIIKGFPDTSAPAGEQLRLDIRIGGIPEPDVIWYKDERPLSPTSKFTFLFEGEDMCSLMIDQAVPDDEGLYKMTAINMAGEVSHSAKVTVPDPEQYFFSDSCVKIKKAVKVEDEYDVLAELGKGAYGVVRKCVHRKTGKQYAVKVIHVKNGMWQDLRREVLVMGMLDHKRLIKLYDAYQTKKDIIMIMELVSGGELFERIVSQDHITETETVLFIKQIIEGVHHMHQKNIVHLDLKPENILLVSPDSDDLKVIDFGLARVVSPDRDVICKFGTPEFVAPEVVCKQPVSTASDVWSIGVMAYILLSGISPFMGDDDKQTLQKVKRGYWDFDDEVWDDISQEAKEFLKAVLVMNPKKRQTLDQCLQHPWLKFDERHDQGVAKLSTQRLKTFNSRRKWQKALTAVKSAMRLRRLSSIAASDISALQQRRLQAKGQRSNSVSLGEKAKSSQTGDGEGRNTGMGTEFLACPFMDEDLELAAWSDFDVGIQPLPCIIDDSMGTGDADEYACLMVPSLKPHSTVSDSMHGTNVLSATTFNRKATTKGMQLLDIIFDACAVWNNACHVDVNASCVHCAQVHELCCCCKCVICRSVQDLVDSSSVIVDKSTHTDVDLVDEKNLSDANCIADKDVLLSCSTNSDASFSVPRCLQETVSTTMENMLIIKDVIDSLQGNINMAQAFSLDGEWSRINAVNCANVTMVSCERKRGVKDHLVFGKDGYTEPITTLAACYTENIPDLDLGAVPPGQAAADLESMKQENGKAEHFTFDIGVNGAVGNEKNMGKLTGEGAGKAVCNEAGESMQNGEDKSLNLEKAQRNIGKANWGTILRNVGKSTPSQTNPASESTGKQMHPGMAAFSKRQWSKSKLVLPSLLKRIQENRSLSTEEMEPAETIAPKEDVDHNCNSSSALPRKLSNKWSKESIDSVDFGEEEDVVEETASVLPDVMAVDSRHCAEKRRRNKMEVEAPQQPKLLSITELMMKHSRDNKKQKEWESNGSSLQKQDLQKLSVTDKAPNSNGRNPALSRLRTVSFNASQEQELKGHLDFLVCQFDDRLNLGQIPKWFLLRYNRWMRLITGIVFGMVVGMLCRIVF